METFHQKIFCIIYAPPKIFINIIHCRPHQVETRYRGWTSECHKFCWLREGLTSLDNVKIRYFHLRNEFYLVELENCPLEEYDPPSKRTPLCLAQQRCFPLSSARVTASLTNEPPTHLIQFLKVFVFPIPSYYIVYLIFKNIWLLKIVKCFNNCDIDIFSLFQLLATKIIFWHFHYTCNGWWNRHWTKEISAHCPSSNWDHS